MIFLKDKATLKNKTWSNDTQITYFIQSILTLKTEKWIENYQTKTLWYAQLCCSSKSPTVAVKKPGLLTMKCFLL